MVVAGNQNHSVHVRRAAVGIVVFRGGAFHHRDIDDCLNHPILIGRHAIKVDAASRFLFCHPPAKINEFRIGEECPVLWHAGNEFTGNRTIR